MFSQVREWLRSGIMRVTEGINELNVSLTSRKYKVTITVINNDGDPVPNCTITIYRLQEGYTSRVEETFKVRNDSSGIAYIDLPKGDYRMYILGRPGYRDYRGGIIRIDYRNREVLIIMEYAEMYTYPIIGKVTDKISGLPIVGGRVEFSRSGGGYFITLTTNKDGAYQGELNSPPSAYFGVRASHEDYIESEWEMFTASPGIIAERNIILVPK